MKSVWILAPADIKVGVLKGQKGKVVGFDSSLQEVEIELDDYTTVVMKPEHIDQSNYMSNESKKVNKGFK